MTKLGKERELLDLFAIIHGSRPKLVTKLEKPSGAYKTDVNGPVFHWFGENTGPATVADFQLSFIKRIDWTAVGCSEGRMVFDRCLDHFLPERMRPM